MLAEVVGITLLSGIGLMDISKIVVPETFTWPQIVVGVLLGVGFVVSGYGPGTAVVSAASGHSDALCSLGGVMVGPLVFGLLYPLVVSLYSASSMGVVTFPDLLGIPWSVVAPLVAAMAIGAFLIAERLERHFTAKELIAERLERHFAAKELIAAPTDSLHGALACSRRPTVYTSQMHRT